MGTARTVALQELANIARSAEASPTERLQAANSLISATREDDFPAPRWHDIGVRDLAFFFLKTVVAATPAALLMLIMYISFIIFNGVAAQVLGGL